MTLVSDFRTLLRLSDLAMLDLREPKLTLTPDPTRVSYEGLHAGGVIKDASVVIEGLEEGVAVGVKELLGGLSLLGENSPLTLRFKAPTLTLMAGGKRLALRTSRSSLYRPPRLESIASVIVGRAVLLDALRFLTEVTTKKVTSPVLTGIHVVTTGEGLRLEASDGVRAGIVEVLAKQARGAIDTVVPAIDFSLAAQAMKNEILFRQTQSVVELVESDGYVRLSTLVGQFPDLSQLPTSFKRRLKVGVGVIEAVTKAGALLDYSRSALLKASQGRILFKVLGEELGSFEIAVGKDDPVADFEIYFDTEYLSTAMRLGAELEIKLNGSSSPALIEGSNGWKYWLSPLSSA